jgi:hypothetical protein
MSMNHPSCTEGDWISLVREIRLKMGLLARYKIRLLAPGFSIRIGFISLYKAVAVSSFDLSKNQSI